MIGRPYRVEDCLELGAVYVSERLEIEFDCRLDSGGEKKHYTKLVVEDKRGLSDLFSNDNLNC